MRLTLYLTLLMLLSACNLGSTATTESPTPTIAITEGERTVIAWASEGNLMVWQTGDTVPRRIASGGVVQPVIAPDGQRIAFTRGAQGRTETLWIVETSGQAEQQLIGERPAEYVPGENQIGDVVWWDERTLYFNTLQVLAPFSEPKNDLYRVDAITREITSIASAGEGGRISVSPNRQTLLTVFHGTYGNYDGVIRRMDVSGQGNHQEIARFVGVSTGSEFRFYPEIFWITDDLIQFAIPDPDILYTEIGGGNIGGTALWQVPLSSPIVEAPIGSILASFFGQPTWSGDGSTVIYYQRDTADSFTAYLAEGNGNNPQAIFSGNLDAISEIQWIPNTNSYVYADPDAEGGAPRPFLIRTADAEPRVFDDAQLYRVRFLNSTDYVAITQGQGRLEMRLNQMDGETQFIGSLNGLVIFDALHIE